MMLRSLAWTALVIFAAIIGLALSVAFVAGAQAQSPAAVVQDAITQATPPAAFSGPWGNGGWGMGPGMMGAYGYGHMGGMMGGYGGWGYDAAPQGAPAPVDADAVVQLIAADSRFDPATITVKAGEVVQVVIANRDSLPHNLYSPDVPIAYTLLPAEVTRSAIFTAPAAAGTYLAVCTFHPGMNLEIVVK